MQCCHWCNRSCNNITQVDNVERSWVWSPVTEWWSQERSGLTPSLLESIFRTFWHSFPILYGFGNLHGVNLEKNRPVFNIFLSTHCCPVLQCEERVGIILWSLLGVKVLNIVELFCCRWVWQWHRQSQIHCSLSHAFGMNWMLLLPGSHSNYSNAPLI